MQVGQAAILEVATTAGMACVAKLTRTRPAELVEQALDYLGNKTDMLTRPPDSNKLPSLAAIKLTMEQCRDKSMAAVKRRNSIVRKAVQSSY